MLIMHVKRFLCQLWNNFYKYLVAFEDIHIHYTYTKNGKSCLDKVNCLWTKMRRMTKDRFNTKDKIVQNILLIK